MDDQNRGPEEPFVTIALPTYNRAATFLPEALAAACGQTYRHLEILVSDNASGDATEALVKSQMDPRIRYHRHPQNIGALANINSCIENARGEYILILMDDDLIDPDFTACCVEALRQNPSAGLIRTGTRVVNAEGSLLYESLNLVSGLDFTQFVLAWLEGKTAPFLCSTMFRTVPLREIGMTSRHGLWDDVITELRLAARFGRVDVPDAKATFCMHSASMTAEAQIEKWCEDSEELVDVVCALAPSDAELLRGRLVPFMAMFNYRNAVRLQGPWLGRLRAFRTVHRHFGAPKRPTELVRELAWQTRWFETLRRVRRAYRAARVG